MNLDPRIGTLQGERGVSYYAFVGGYREPEVRGSLARVELALGLRKRSVGPLKDVALGPYLTVYDVELTAFYRSSNRPTRSGRPSMAPVLYEGIRAPSKSAANAEALRQRMGTHWRAHYNGGMPIYRATLREV